MPTRRSTPDIATLCLEDIIEFAKSIGYPLAELARTVGYDESTLRKGARNGAGLSFQTAQLIWAELLKRKAQNEAEAAQHAAEAAHQRYIEAEQISARLVERNARPRRHSAGDDATTAEA